MGKYDTTRYNHNLNKGWFETAGEFGIPVIEPVRDLDPPAFTAFDFAVTKDRKGEGTGGYRGIHFFRDDYRFERLWNDPDAYVSMFRGYDVVLSPDFSTYVDWPQAVQLYNHFRKHWLAAYMQSWGITVVPTISWGDPSSHAWCFDGEPEDGIVAVGSRGSVADPEVRGWFEEGFEAMVERLRPSAVWAFGPRMGVYDRYPGLVVPVSDENTDRLRRVVEDKAKRAARRKGEDDGQR